MLSRLKFWAKKEQEAEEEPAKEDADADGASSSDDDDDDEEEEEKPPPPVNLDDFAAVKRALDDAVVEAVLDRGYVEDGRLFGAKLGLGLSACAVALLAQFYPGKPPETSGVLAWCIAAYVVLTAAAAAFSMVAEGDAFLVTRQPPPASAAAPKASSGPAAAAAAAAVAKAAAKEAGPPLPPLRVSSNMARFEPEYELVLKSHRRVGGGGGGGGKAASGSRNQQPFTKVEARAQLKATSFFRSDGTMDLAALQRDVGALLDEIEAEASAKGGSGGGGGGGGGSSRGGGAATRSSPRTKKN